MLQLFSNKICVCGCIVFYSRRGVKQGGVLSGIIFSSCYDDLVDMLRSVGAGILIKTAGKNLSLIFVLIYADDVILFSTSPFGLRRLRGGGEPSKSYFSHFLTSTISQPLPATQNSKTKVFLCLLECYFKV